MAEAIDHLADQSGQHVDLLQALSDAELDEQIEWYRDEALRTSGRDHWGFSNLLSTALVVQRERHEND